MRKPLSNEQTNEQEVISEDSKDRQPGPTDKPRKESWEISEEIVPQNQPCELPLLYGEDTLVVMVKDPNWLYAYWELTPLRWKEFHSSMDPKVIQDSVSVLRIYDVTDILFDGFNAHSHFDQTIHPLANNWYINVPQADRNYCVDLGRLLPDGTFITLLRSNTVAAPRMSLSSVIDHEWPPIEEIYRSYAGQDYHRTLSSPELMKKQ